MRFDLLIATFSFLASVTTAAAATQRNPRGQSLNPRLTALPLGPRDLPIGTCNENTPCSNKACCSKKGYGLLSSWRLKGSLTNLLVGYVDTLQTFVAMDAHPTATPRLNADRMLQKISRNVHSTFAAPSLGKFIDRPTRLRILH